MSETPLYFYLFADIYCVVISLLTYIVLLSLCWYTLCCYLFADIHCVVISLLTYIVLLSLCWCTLCCYLFADIHCAVISLLTYIVLLSLCWHTLYCYLFADVHCAVISLLIYIVLSLCWHTLCCYLFADIHCIVISLLTYIVLLSLCCLLLSSSIKYFAALRPVVKKAFWIKISWATRSLRGPYKMNWQDDVACGPGAWDWSSILLISWCLNLWSCQQWL